MTSQVRESGIVHSGDDSSSPLGATVIGKIAKTLSGHPGVYRMLNRNREVLYVGKAKNLRKRVSSYMRPMRHDGRIARMIGQTSDLEIIITETEAEALLL